MDHAIRVQHLNIFDIGKHGASDAQAKRKGARMAELNTTYSIEIRRLEVFLAAAREKLFVSDTKRRG